MENDGGIFFFFYKLESDVDEILIVDETTKTKWQAVTGGLYGPGRIWTMDSVRGSGVLSCWTVCTSIHIHTQ